MNDKIKLLSVPQAEPAPQPTPTFPNTNIAMVPQGLVININLAPGLTLGQLIDAASMDQIAKEWLTSRVQIRQQDLAVIRKAKTKEV